MLTSKHRFTTYQSMRTDLWGSRKGILIVCFLLSKFEKRSLNAAASSCGRGYFRKRSSCGYGYSYRVRWVNLGVRGNLGLFAFSLLKRS